MFTWNDASLYLSAISLRTAGSREGIPGKWVEARNFRLKSRCSTVLSRVRVRVRVRQTDVKLIRRYLAVTGHREII